MGGCASGQSAQNRRNQENAANNNTTAQSSNGGNNANGVEPSATSNARQNGPSSAEAGANSPNSQSGRSRRDRSVRQAPIVKSLIGIENDQIKLKPSGGDSYTLDISFSTAQRDFEITAMFNAHVEDPQAHNVIPKVHCPDKSGEFRKRVSDEQTVTFGDIPKSLLSHMSSPKEMELPHSIPLVIQITSLKEDFKSPKVNAIWLYCNLKKDDEKCEIFVLKKLIARGGRAYLLQNLFGGTVTVPGTEGDGQECVVCLSAPREVVVLHCKHVCLCKQCASVTSSTWSYQCPLCRGRVAAFVAVDDKLPPP